MPESDPRATVTTSRNRTGRTPRRTAAAPPVPPTRQPADPGQRTSHCRRPEAPPYPRTALDPAPARRNRYGSPRPHQPRRRRYATAPPSPRRQHHTRGRTRARQPGWVIPHLERPAPTPTPNSAPAAPTPDTQDCRPAVVTRATPRQTAGQHQHPDLADVLDAASRNPLTSQPTNTSMPQTPPIGCAPLVVHNRHRTLNNPPATYTRA